MAERNASKKDAFEVGRSLSRASQAEIFASGGWRDGPRYVRAMQNRSGECHVLRSRGGVALAVVGLLPVAGGWAAPWAVTTRAAARHPITLYKFFRSVLDAWRTARPQMIMHVHGLDTGGLRLAAALGLKPGVPVHRNHGMFCEILIITKKVEVA